MKKPLHNNRSKVGIKNQNKTKTSYAKQLRLFYPAPVDTGWFLSVYSEMVFALFSNDSVCENSTSCPGK